MFVKDNHHIYFIFQEGSLHFPRRMETPGDSEILTSIQPINDFPCHHIIRGIENSKPDIFYLRTDSEAE